MSRRLPFLLLTLVLVLPLLGLGWLGWRLSLEQQHAWERQLSEVLERRLWDQRQQAMTPVAAMARRIDEVTRQSRTESPAAQVAALRALPFVEQVLLLGPGGDLRWPDRDQASLAQRRFLDRVAPLWQGKALLHTGTRLGESADAAAATSGPRSGWLAWHWGQGMELMYWQRDRRHGVVAVTVDRIGLLADIIGALPESGGAAGESFQLVDENGGLLYQWGDYRPATQQAPRVELALAAPLDSWRLGLHFDDQYLTMQGGRLQALQIVIAVGTLALVLLGLGLWLFRELRRAGREARQRVNFVNQVSHELRTPLTNIRMYAELLEGELVDEGPIDNAAARTKLDVIVSESRRLGRLIGNVLSFARQEKKTLKLNRVRASLDELVDEVVAQFRPGLEARGIALTLDLGGLTEFDFDCDAVTGIIGNLLSNAEKYAPKAPLSITTSERSGRALVAVRDGGAGIARHHRKRIFRAFYRIDDKLTEGVSGTGIGLSIARDLARLHGGELRLIGGGDGTCFELELPM